MRLRTDQRDEIERSLKLVGEAGRVIAGAGLPATTLRIELGAALSQAKAILENFLDQR
jgi:hypothetical protein